MWMVFYGIAALLGLVAVVCAIVIVVHAFKHSTKQGLLCVVIPCYILYFGIAKLEHPRKGLLLAGMIGGPILAAVSANAATAVFGPDVLEQVDDAQRQAGSEGGDAGAGEQGTGKGGADSVDFESEFEDF